MINMDYLTLLNSDPIPIPNVGHIRQPTLKEIVRLGYKNYNQFLYFLCLKKNSLVSTDQLVSKLNDFEIFFNIPETREMYYNIFSFFMCEFIEISVDYQCYLIYQHDDHDKNEKPIGYINKDNFDDVRNVIAQTQYIIKVPEFKDTTNISEHAKKLLEMRDKGRKQSNKKEKNDADYGLANIVSSLCIYNTVGINLINIWDYTVFQVYDQYARLDYKRLVDVGSMNYACWGGDFDISKWNLNLFEQTKQNKERMI